MTIEGVQDENARLRERIGSLETMLAEKERAEAALGKERDFLRTIVDTVDAKITVLDLKKQKLVFFNRAIRDFSGHSAKSIEAISELETAMKTMVDEEGGRIAAEQMQRAISTKQPVTAELWNINKDGTRRRYSWTATATFDDAGNPEYLLASGIDVTDRWNAEEELRKEKEFLDTILDTTEAMITVLDIPNTRIVAYNRAVREKSGYTLDDILVAVTDDPTNSPGVPPEERENMRRLLMEAISTGKPVNHEMWNIPKNGGKMRNFYTLRASYDTQGKPKYLVSSGIDVTDRWNAEEARREAKEEAEEALRLKQAFITLISHDIIAPLSLNLRALRQFGDECSATLDDAQGDSLNAMIARDEKLLENVRRMFDIAMLHTGKLRPNPAFLDARALVNGAFGGLQKAAELKGIRLVNGVPEGTRLYADIALLGSVISNLVYNAIKFSGPGSEVALFVPPGENATLAVRDRGAGIAAEMLPDLFNHGVRTTSLGTGGERGTGLGLPYAMDIAKAHNGNIEVETEEGRGSVFYVRLPDIKPVVLVAGGGGAWRESARDVLRGLRMETLEAKDADDGLELAAKNRVSLLLALLDDCIFNKDFLAAFQKRFVGSIPFVAVSPSTDIEELIQLGAAEVLASPPDAVALTEIVTRLLV